MTLGRKIRTRVTGLLETLETGRTDSGDLEEAQKEEAVRNPALYEGYREKATAAYNRAQSIVRGCARLFNFMSAVQYTNDYGDPLSPQRPEQSYSWAYKLIELVSKVEDAMWDDDEIDVTFEDFPE